MTKKKEEPREPSRYRRAVNASLVRLVGSHRPLSSVEHASLITALIDALASAIGVYDARTWRDVLKQGEATGLSRDALAEMLTGAREEAMRAVARRIAESANAARTMECAKLGIPE